MAEINHNDFVVRADRWASRRARAIAFLKANGVIGTASAIRQAGFGNTVQFIKRNIRYSIAIYSGRRWDQKHHVDTGGQLELDAVSAVGTHKDLGHPVVSTSPKTFRFLTMFFPPDRARYTYIDMGSGKGRTVLMASSLGFRKVVGVEFVDVACEIAFRNIQTFKGPGNLSNSEIIHTDIFDYDLPKDNLVLYFGNPFLATLWTEFLTQIGESLASTPRSIYLILAGSQPEKISQGASLIGNSGLFVEMGRGTAPYFLDTYLPFAYAAFKTPQTPV